MTFIDNYSSVKEHLFFTDSIQADTVQTMELMLLALVDLARHHHGAGRNHTAHSDIDLVVDAIEKVLARKDYHSSLTASSMANVLNK